MLVEEFKNNLIEDGKSANTVQSYVGDISGFLKYLGKIGVEFEGTLKRFYIASYKNKTSDSEYLILDKRGAVERDTINTLLERHTLKYNNVREQMVRLKNN